MDTQLTAYSRLLTATVQSYYRFVDASDLDRLIELFAQDTVYYRGSLTITGLSALEQFYRQDRIIADGCHTFSLTVDAPNVLSRGHFSGTLKNGEHVEVDFVDKFVFEGAKIVKRTTTFPQREI